MTTLPLLATIKNTTTAVTLGGTGGAAEYDMDLYLYTVQQVQVEVSVNGTNFSTGVAHAPGAKYIIPAGCKVRLRNTDAVNDRDSLITYERRR